VAVTSTCSSGGIFAAATNKTNQTNKAVFTIKQSFLNMMSMGGAGSF